MFKILGASLDERRWDYLSRRDVAAVLAAEQASRRDGLAGGSYDPARLGWVLARADRAQLADAARVRQEAWLYGRSLTTGQSLPAGYGDLAPVPRLQARGGGAAAPSPGPSSAKLNRKRSRRPVPWPERYSATDYLNLLVREALEIPMTSTAWTPPSELFSTVPRKIAVTSGKGGVGKTTTAAALASAMARALEASGQWVWLIDLNLPNPGQHVLWGLGAVQADNDAGLIYGSEVQAGLRVFSHAQLAPGGRPDRAVIPVERAAEWIAFLAGVLDLRGCGAIVFDLPPGWDSVHKVIFDDSRVGLIGVVHVTTGDPLAALPRPSLTATPAVPRCGGGWSRTCPVPKASSPTGPGGLRRSACTAPAVTSPATWPTPTGWPTQGRCRGRPARRAWPVPGDPRARCGAHHHRGWSSRGRLIRPDGLTAAPSDPGLPDLLPVPGLPGMRVYPVRHHSPVDRPDLAALLQVRQRDGDADA